MIGNGRLISLLGQHVTMQVLQEEAFGFVYLVWCAYMCIHCSCTADIVCPASLLWVWPPVAGTILQSIDFTISEGTYHKDNLVLVLARLFAEVWQTAFRGSCKL